MPKSKNVDLIKVTMNLRDGDLAKMGELFPSKRPSVAVRDLISAFVDKHFEERKTETIKLPDTTTL